MMLSNRTVISSFVQFVSRFLDMLINSEYEDDGDGDDDNDD